MTGPPRRRNKRIRMVAKIVRWALKCRAGSKAKDGTFVIRIKRGSSTGRKENAGLHGGKAARRKRSYTNAKLRRLSLREQPRGMGV